MTPTRLPDVIDALVAMFTAAVEPLQDGGIPVLDGPPPVDEPKRYMSVGDEGDEDESDSALVRAWAGLGGQAMDEEGSVTCCAIAWVGGSGGTSVRDQRERAFEMFSACEEAHRADLNLGGLVLFSRIAEVTYRPFVNDQGTGARVRFTIDYKARI